MRVDHDCVIVGAGFAGLRAFVEMRRRGFTARVIEAGSDVGGTWYWNRYPGARSDSDAYTYCFSFDDDLLQDWDWRERYSPQPQIQAYLAHVADRFDVRGHVDLDTRVESMVRNEASNTWTVRTDRGDLLNCTYVITAVGPLSAPYVPPFPGLDSFRGEQYLTARWPEQKIDFTGKRVGVIGTGSSAVQLIPAVAQTAAHLTVFQRTPNYVIPARNGPIEEGQLQAIKANYRSIWENVRRQPTGFPVRTVDRAMTELDAAEARRVLERGWEVGGFRFMLETFTDLMLDEQTNAVVAEFVRDKIRSIVEDPKTAELLCPKNHPIGSRRPPMGNHYYETYNRDNVTLVDVRATPVAGSSETGIRLADGTEYELDVLILATGFDAATGSLTAIDIRGSDGQALAEVWRNGARNYLGVAIPDYPNLFMVGGPGYPPGNFPPIAEAGVEWIGELLTYMRETGTLVMEADEVAADAWMRDMQNSVNRSLGRYGEAAGAWAVGANVPGKPHVPLFYTGGLTAWVDRLKACAAHEYGGFAPSHEIRRPAPIV
jgi:cyclohexanone monooxygenase